MHARTSEDSQGALESRYSERLTEESPVIPWMIMHAAGILNKFRMGADGHTAYQRVKGRAFSRRLAEFGECVWFLKPKTAGISKADIGGMTESGSASTTTPGKHTWALNQESRRSEPSAGRALRPTGGMRRNCEAPRDPHRNQCQEEKVQR